MTIFSRVCNLSLNLFILQLNPYTISHPIPFWFFKYVLLEVWHKQLHIQLNQVYQKYELSPKSIRIANPHDTHRFNEGFLYIVLKTSTALRNLTVIFGNLHRH